MTKNTQKNPTITTGRKTTKRQTQKYHKSHNNEHRHRKNTLNYYKNIHKTKETPKIHIKWQPNTLIIKYTHNDHTQLKKQKHNEQKKKKILKNPTIDTQWQKFPYNPTMSAVTDEDSSECWCSDWADVSSRWHSQPSLRLWKFPVYCNFESDGYGFVCLSSRLWSICLAHYQPKSQANYLRINRSRGGDML